ncbi:MAG: FHA domain-containing protein [Planctomycetota bacterium]
MASDDDTPNKDDVSKDDKDDCADRTVVIRTQPKPYFEILQELPGKIRIEVIRGPMDGHGVSLSADQLTVGRSQDNDLVLPLDLRVSSHHARVLRDGAEYFVEDLESRNGTYLGEKRVLRRAPIRPGTVFVVGGTCLEFMPR